MFVFRRQDPTRTSTQLFLFGLTALTVSGLYSCSSESNPKTSNFSSDHSSGVTSSSHSTVPNLLSKPLSKSPQSSLSTSDPKSGLKIAPGDVSANPLKPEIPPTLADDALKTPTNQTDLFKEITQTSPSFTANTKELTGTVDTGIAGKSQIPSPISPSTSVTPSGSSNPSTSTVPTPETQPNLSSNLTEEAKSFSQPYNKAFQSSSSSPLATPNASKPASPFGAKTVSGSNSLNNTPSSGQSNSAPSGQPNSAPSGQPNSASLGQSNAPASSQLKSGELRTVEYVYDPSTGTYKTDTSKATQLNSPLPSQQNNPVSDPNVSPNASPSNSSNSLNASPSNPSNSLTSPNSAPETNPYPTP